MTTIEASKLNPGDILFMNNNKIYCFIERSSESFIKCQHLMCGNGIRFNTEIVQLNIMFNDTLQSLILKKHCQ